MSILSTLVFITIHSWIWLNIHWSTELSSSSSRVLESYSIQVSSISIQTPRACYYASITCDPAQIHSSIEIGSSQSHWGNHTSRKRRITSCYADGMNRATSSCFLNQKSSINHQNYHQCRISMHRVLTRREGVEIESLKIFQYLIQMQTQYFFWDPIIKVCQIKRMKKMIF